MKILAIICEFNPFHNGHKYLIEQAKKQTDRDAVLCIMSGNFTQRGEMCILDKYTRARHAVLGGADCVIQLPAPFAVAPAEIFAAGAIKILSAIPDVCTLVFGCESGNAEEFKSAAELLIDESDKFKSILEEKLGSGESYVKSYAEAFKACGGNRELIENPNNILGLEYCKAILRLNADLNILPVKRVGSGYNDGRLAQNFSSASAIRKNIENEKIKDNVPSYVFGDLKHFSHTDNYEGYLKNCLFMTSADKLKETFGCSEGLENKLKNLENLPFGEIISKATSKRYSASRIMRILCANALGISRSETEKLLKEKLYLKPLAVKKERADEILACLAKSEFPVITGIDGVNRTDAYELKLYNYLNKLNIKDYMQLI